MLGVSRTDIDKIVPDRQVQSQLDLAGAVAADCAPRRGRASIGLRAILSVQATRTHASAPRAFAFRCQDHGRRRPCRGGRRTTGRSSSRSSTMGATSSTSSAWTGRRRPPARSRRDKARSAIMFKRPTKALEDRQSSGGRVAMMTVNATTMVEGGLPIVYKDTFVGAIGISGPAVRPGRHRRQGRARRAARPEWPRARSKATAARARRFAASHKLNLKAHSFADMPEDIVTLRRTARALTLPPNNAG